MNKEDYREFATNECALILQIIKAKNSDYSDGDDPFANFRIAENVGVDTLTGLWIRMEDKFQRIRAYLNRGDLKVENEGIEDAFRDTIGYALLALGILEERRRGVLMGDIVQTAPEDNPAKSTMHIDEPGAFDDLMVPAPTTEDIINGLKHMADDHPCCAASCQMAITRLEANKDLNS